VSALAHPLDPALLELREQRDARVEVRFQSPLPAGSLQPALPAHCVAVSPPRSTVTPRTALQSWQVDCGAGSLVGERIGVDGLRARQTDALLRIELRDGRLIQSVLRPDRPFMTIPEPADGVAVAVEYFSLGFRHLISGPDHLLFLLGLVLLASGLRRLLWTITAFTLGHSITLSLALLGFVHVPPAPVEVLIAVSIIVVATELARAAAGDAPRRAVPAFLASSFGLLHGLGFAGALAQIGLPADDIPLSLFAFNLGIEAGQLLCVGLILVGTAVLRGLPIRWPAITQLAPAYTIGSLAVLWMLERLAVLL
jgi:hydrogenase/urease accessory protein HupE